MKERPILFSGPMVRALLSGTKTQTRRFIKPQPQHSGFAGRHVLAKDDEGIDLYLHSSTLAAAIRSPYGGAGDCLWVRETWARNANQLSDTRMDISLAYRADGETRAMDNGCDLPWRPSIHMPRFASRITLGVTEVRVQRLQDISEEDAVADGIVPHRKGGWWWEQPPAGIAGTNHFGAKTEIDAYRALWESINGPGSWDLNPWVWVIEFKRL